MGPDSFDSVSSEVSELADAPHLPLGQVLLNNAPLLRQAGLLYPTEQHLGRGTFGAAYEIPYQGSSYRLSTRLAPGVREATTDRSVLKFTRDPTEVQASTLLTGRDTKRIVPVYGVWYLRDTGVNDLRRWYVVHRGYLEPLGDRDKALVELLFALYDDMSLDLVIPRSPKQHATIAKWRGYVRDELMGDGGRWTDDEGNVQGGGALGVGKMVKRCLQLLLQVGAAVHEMHQAGIDWEDFHSDNMMRDGSGRLLIGDVGWGLMHEDFDAEVATFTPEVIAQHFGGSPPAQPMPSASRT